MDLPKPAGASQTPTSARARVSWILAGALVLGSPFLIWGAYLSPRLDYDDKIIIEENPLSQEGFTLNALEQVARPPLGDFRGYYRQYTPLSHLGTGLQWAMTGPDWSSFRLVNLLFHLAAAGLLYQILLLLLSRVSSSSQEWSAERETINACCAALGSAFFFFHPTNVESVAWAAERSNVQALFFCILAWRLLLVPGTQEISLGKFGTPSGRRYACALLAYGCALLSKPSAIGFAPMFLLIEICWMEGDGKRRWRQGMGFVLLGAMAAYLALRAGRADLLPVTGGSLSAWALTTFGLLGRYAALALWPNPLSFFYGVEVIDSLLHPWIGIAAVLLVGGIALLSWLPVKSRFAWVLLIGAIMGLAPKLTPRTNAYLLQDRYLYFSLPMAGALLALACGAWRERLRQLKPEFGRAMASTGFGTAVLVCAAFAILALQRSFDFGASERLFRDAVFKQPRSYFARYQLAQELKFRALTENLTAKETGHLLLEAHQHLIEARKAVDAERQNDPVEARLLEGEIDYRIGLPSARTHLEFVVRQSTPSQVFLRSKARWFLAELAQREYLETKRYEPLEVRAGLLHAIAQEGSGPEIGKVQMALAWTLERLGRKEQAEEAYRKALSDPDVHDKAKAELERLTE